MKIKYITTAIDYPNSLPHIGHAYEKILADFYNRYYKQKGENTFYQTGTDEHGIKIYNTAKNNKVTPKKLVDSNSKKFKEFYRILNMTTLLELLIKKIIGPVYKTYGMN